MCYNAPGPRCANHTRTLFRETKAAYIVASDNFEKAKDNLADAEDTQAEARLIRSEKLLKLAEANHADATKNYEASKADRAEKMEAYREARLAYRETAEGIQGLRDAGQYDEAEKFATIRAMKMEELKRVEAAKADIANGAVRAVIEKPVVKEAPKYPPFTADEQAEFDRVTSTDIERGDTLVFLSRIETIHPRLQMAYATHPDARTRKTLVQNLGANDEALRVLVQDKDDYIAFEAINHSNASVDTIAVAVSSGRDKLVHKAIQSHKWDMHCRENPTPTLDNSDLGKIYERSAMMDLHLHPSREHFERLAKDEQYTVARAVASHPDCPQDIKMDLLRHPTMSVRQGVIPVTFG